jgi:hypothetical protein
LARSFLMLERCFEISDLTISPICSNTEYHSSSSESNNFYCGVTRYQRLLGLNYN